MNLLKSLTDQFGGQIVKGLAGNLGVGENEARSSMNGALPSILGGLINKVGNNKGADELFDLVKKDDYSGGMLDNLGSLFSGGNKSSLLKTGAAILPMLLGGNNRMGSVLDIAGRLFGGGASRQRSVLGMIAPLVISFIGKKLRGGNNLNKTGLIDLLKGQRGHVQDALHPELASSLGFGNEKEVQTEQVHTEHHREESSGGGMGFLKWLLPLLLLGALGFFLMRGCGGDTDVKKVEDKQPTKVERTETKPKPVESTKPAVQKPTTQKPVQQNNNTKNPAQGNQVQTKPAQKPAQTKPANTSAQNNATTKPVGTVTYTGVAKQFQDAANAGSPSVINFGALSPDGKALSDPAKKRLDQIATIMKATPTLNIEVRGHNKDLGNKVKNGPARAASKIRAGLVQAYLITKGIKGNRIKTSSVGHDEPLDNVPPTDDKQKRITIKTTK